MLKRFCCIFILILLFTTLSGCQGEMEVDRISFPVAMGIDHEEESNTITVYAQISVPSGSPGGQPQTKKTYKVLIGHGDTLLDAIADITSQGSQNISWKHITVVVITSKMAEHGITDELGLLSRFHQIHMNAYIMLTDESLQELLESPTIIESSLPTPLAAIRLVSDQSSHAKVVTIREFLMAYINEGGEPVMPIVSIIKGSGEEIVIDYPGLGVFKKDKLKGELDSDETKGAILIYGKKNISRIKIPDPGKGKHKEFTIRSITCIPRIIPEMQHEIPGITIKLEVGYILTQLSIPRVINSAEVDRINRQVEEYIRENVRETIHKTQKDFEADIFAFGEKIYRKYPGYWQENKKRWDEIFPEVAVNIEVKASLKNTGEALNSMQYLEVKN